MRVPSVACTQQAACRTRGVDARCNHARTGATHVARMFARPRHARRFVGFRGVSLGLRDANDACHLAVHEVAGDAHHNDASTERTIGACRPMVQA